MWVINIEIHFFIEHEHHIFSLNIFVYEESNFSFRKKIFLNEFSNKLFKKVKNGKNKIEPGNGSAKFPVSRWNFAPGIPGSPLPIHD